MSVAAPGHSPAAQVRRGAKVLSVQYLRACAALMVVFHHAREQFPQFPAPFHTVAGQAGVDLFFVISGFVMVLVTSTREQSPADFIRSRITRIVPIYWFYTFACWGLLLLAPTLFQANDASLRHLVLSLFFIPHTTAATAGSYSPLVKLGWTLNYEVFFYLLFTLAMLLSFRRRIAITTTALAVLLCAPAVAWLLHTHISGVASFYTNQMVAEFGLGMLIAAAWFSGKLDRLPVSAAVVLIVVGLTVMLSLAPRVDSVRLLVFGLPAAAIVMGALILERSGAIGVYPRLLLIGDASYSLYLVQIFPIAILRAVWHRFELPSQGWLGAISFVTLSLLGAVLAALISYFAIEKPSLRVLRKRLGGKRAVVQVASTHS
jgi:exopolysaccharide production protein ExoZ